jgi:hypothetical protein
MHAGAQAPPPHTHVHVCTYIHTHVHMCTSIHTHTKIHTHTHKKKHTGTQRQREGGLWAHRYTQPQNYELLVWRSEDPREKPVSGCVNECTSVIITKHAGTMSINLPWVSGRTIGYHKTYIWGARDQPQ